MIVRTEANVKAESYRKLVRNARENQAIGWEGKLASARSR